MQKIYIFLLSILQIISYTSFSQNQDPWVGTWTSTAYWDMDADGDTYQETQYKLVIRITKYGEQYNVRAKTIKIKDPSFSYYHRPYTITRIEQNAIWLQNHVDKDPFTVDYGNGPFIESYSDITYFYKLTLNNGNLHYSHYKMHSIEYDKNMRYVDEQDINTSKMRGSELDLFNDNW